MKFVLIAWLSFTGLSHLTEWFDRALAVKGGKALSKVHNIYAMILHERMTDTNAPIMRDDNEWPTTEVWLNAPEQLLERTVVPSRRGAGSFESGLDHERILGNGRSILSERHQMARLPLPWLQCDPHSLGLSVAEVGLTQVDKRLVRGLRVTDETGFDYTLLFDETQFAARSALTTT
jgi:hypothetical protein